MGAVSKLLMTRYARFGYGGSIDRSFPNRSRKRGIAAETAEALKHVDKISPGGGFAVCDSQLQSSLRENSETG
jgi:hypothetical protein